MFQLDSMFQAAMVSCFKSTLDHKLKWPQKDLSCELLAYVVLNSLGNKA